MVLLEIGMVVHPLCLNAEQMWRNWYTRTLEVRVVLDLASSSLAICIALATSGSFLYY
jgi:hypothetical protein